MKNQRTGLGLSLAFLLAAGIGVLAYAAGTALSISFSDATIDCQNDGSAEVTFHYTVTSTGAADAATVTGQLDEGDSFNLTTIASGNADSGGGWTFQGRNRTFSGTYTTTLTSGSHTLTVCAEQHGAQRKSACEETTVEVTCTTTPSTPTTTASCEGTYVYGGVTGSTSLCSAINITFHGDYGQIANLTIYGPNGFTYSTTVARDQTSCDYSYDWDPTSGGTGNGGGGLYILMVTAGSGGSSGSLTIFQELTSCN